MSFSRLDPDRDSDTTARLGRSFRWLLASDALTLLSIMVGGVALPWWIAQSGGARDLAIYGVTIAAMSFIAMPLLSPLADRHPKRALIAAGLFAFGLAASTMAAFASFGHYRLDVVIAIETVTVLATALVNPAVSSIVVELVAPAGLAKALGRQQSAQASGRLVGPAIGGSMLAVAGTAGTLWLHAGLLFAAAALATRLPGPSSNAAPAAARRHWATEVRVGMKANWAIPIERGWIIVNFFAAIFLMPAVTMLVPLKVQSLGLSGVWLGWCEASLSLGMLAGSLAVAPWWVRVQGRFATRMTAQTLQALAIVAVGLAREPALLVAAFAAIGLTNAAQVLVGKTHRMLARPLAFRARMSAGTLMSTQISMTLGPAIAGVALTHCSVATVYVVFGVLFGLCALGFLRVDGFRAFMALDHEQVDNWYGRNFPHVFEQAAGSTPPARSAPARAADEAESTPH